MPAIGMGTWRSFDTEQDRTPIVDEALAAGINLFDSSPMYGKAEDSLARALGERRQEALIATKVWTEDADEGQRQIDHSLSLYGTVDVYQIHNLVNVPAHLPRLEALKEEGRVRAIGATHYSATAFEELCQVMQTGRITAIQIPYNVAVPLATLILALLPSRAGSSTAGRRPGNWPNSASRPGPRRS